MSGHGRGFPALMIAVAILVVLLPVLLEHDGSIKGAAAVPASIIERAVGAAPRRVAVAFGSEGDAFRLQESPAPKKALSKRALPPLSYSKAQSDGRDALNKCNTGPGDKALDLNDVEELWAVEGGDSNSVPTELQNLNKAPFTLLSITSDQQTQEAVQSGDYIEGAEELEPTFGRYTNLFSPAAGTIIALANYGPQYQLDTNDRGDQALPAIVQWSDVAWAVWKNLAGEENEQNLHYIVQNRITNPNTKYIMEQTQNAAAGALKLPWPGKEYSMETPQGQALLGTPNAKGVTWILHDFHTFMKYKTVESIRIFTADAEFSSYHMVITLGH